MRNEKKAVRRTNLLELANDEENKINFALESLREAISEHRKVMEIVLGNPANSLCKSSKDLIKTHLTSIGLILGDHKTHKNVF